VSKQLLISVAELKQKKRFTTWLGRDEVMALMTPDGVRVYSAMCPHQGGPLGEGVIKDNQITCPWHGCSYELTQGDCTDIGTCRNVSGMKLQTLKFTVENDANVYVDLPEPAP